MDQQTQPKIALKFLDIKSNYRRRRSKESLESLAENIKEIGVFTPIVIRSAGNGMFSVIAGSRRVAASRLAHGDDWEIPYILRDDLDEAGALHLSVTENKEREDTTAVEDAEAAEKLLGMLKGDRAETARRLGWSPSTLSRRLALLNATQETRKDRAGPSGDPGRVAPRGPGKGSREPTGHQRTRCQAQGACRRRADEARRRHLLEG